MKSKAVLCWRSRRPRQAGVHLLAAGHGWHRSCHLRGGGTRQQGMAGVQRSFELPAQQVCRLRWPAPSHSPPTRPLPTPTHLDAERGRRGGKAHGFPVAAPLQHRHCKCRGEAVAFRCRQWVGWVGAERREGESVHGGWGRGGRGGLAAALAACRASTRQPIQYALAPAPVVSTTRSTLRACSRHTWPSASAAAAAGAWGSVDEHCRQAGWRCTAAAADLTGLHTMDSACHSRPALVPSPAHPPITLTHKQAAARAELDQYRGHALAPQLVRRSHHLLFGVSGHAWREGRRGWHG